MRAAALRAGLASTLALLVQVAAAHPEQDVGLAARSALAQPSWKDPDPLPFDGWPGAEEEEDEITRLLARTPTTPVVVDTTSMKHGMSVLILGISSNRALVTRVPAVCCPCLSCNSSI